MFKMLLTTALFFTLLQVALAANKTPRAPILTVDGWVTAADSVPLAFTCLTKAGTDSLRAPLVLLLPMMNRDRSSWHGLDTLLALDGFKVLSIDMRGHGASTKRNGRSYRWQEFSDADFANMVSDVGVLLNHARAAAGQGRGRTRLDALLSGADVTRIGLVGASIGSSAALLYAADHPEIGALVLLSPGLNYRGLQTEPAMRRYGARPVYLLAGSEDVSSAKTVDRLYAVVKGEPNPHRVLVVHPTDKHGTDLFDFDLGIRRELAGWLESVLGAK